MSTSSQGCNRPRPLHNSMAARRALQSDKSIKAELKLTNDADYVTFYTAVEQIIKTHGWIQSTFRTISEKETVRKNISELVLADRTLCDRFPATTRNIMKGSQGETAFGFLVYRICSNFRRRTRTKREVRLDRNASPEVGGYGVASLLRVLDTPQTVRNTSPPATIQANAWQSMVSVTQKDGAFKALCRLCELSNHWPENKRSSEYTVDELDFDKFINLLRADHAFHQDDEIAWSRQVASGQMDGLATIDNTRQWRAVVADLLQHGRPLTFSIISRCQAQVRS